eukprot:CAMPEP_0195593124 /NCGR_PEP_ID=MMETSP0815-20121206/717_1 /TAXON_ID=97485 /ORGANISM="Prymnesium parvum, Strain Texoma1" /LENGTH=46 /DNA_ID= /DNA_START= /DNA_END= /DNA_ORIENTATION=
MTCQQNEKAVAKPARTNDKYDKWQRRSCECDCWVDDIEGLLERAVV